MVEGLGIGVRLVSYTVDGVRVVAGSARVSLSRRGVDEVFELGAGEVEEWVRETFRRQHFSPWEHSVYTFIVDGLSRVASHQLVRHRVASYTQQSHRYTEGYLRSMAVEASRVVGAECPERIGDSSRVTAYECYSRVLRMLAETGGDKAVEVASIAFVKPPSLRGDLAIVWASSSLESTSRYYSLLARGVKLEDARYLIPGSVRTRIVVTMNARELIQVFLPLRMCSKTQWELRHIAWLMWRELMRVHPALFKWAGPRCILVENSVRDQPVTVREAIEEVELTIPRCPELVDKKAVPLCLKQAVETAALPDEVKREILRGDS